MALKQPFHEYNPIEKPEKTCFKKRLINFFYNEETNEIMGRTAESWGAILIFYTVFYSCLAALFAICMVTFLQQFINPRIPYYQQEYGLIGNSPGLSFRPLPPDVRSTLISYKGSGYDDYKYWEDELIKFLSVYKQKGQISGAGQNTDTCNFTALLPGKVCDVDISGLKPCIDENHFSFHKSSPCIFIKLNRIFGWLPDFYDVNDLPPDMPLDLRRTIRNMTSVNRNFEKMVWLSCHGENPADQESLGVIRYLPYPGFPIHFFPYWNAEGYLSPLVAIHLNQPKRGIVINIECRAWARNIVYNRKERLGSVHFELMID